MGVPFSVTNMALEPMPQRMPLTFGEDWNVISAWMDAFHGRTIMCSGQEDPGADGRMWDDRVKFIHFFKYLEGPKGCYMKALQMAQCQ